MNDHIELEVATLKDYPTIQNMGRFYVYDMSEYMGGDELWKIPDDGLYECIDFKKYWERHDAFPFIVRLDGEIAGFVIIDKKGSDAEVDFNMAQFFILRKFKSKGLGRKVAILCFVRFKGTWEVMVMPRNTGAYHFWKKVVKGYTKGRFQEAVKAVHHFGGEERIIFRFSSGE